MSTMIALLLMLSSLVGCAGEAMVNAKNALPDPPTQALAFSVELERYEETVRDEDGVVLAECSYELPVLAARLEDGSVLETAASEEQKRALAITETFNARFDQWKSNPAALEEPAREERAFRREADVDFLPYGDELSCTFYQTGNLISVSGSYYTYTGGAHPNTILMSWNFDLEAGEFLEPEILDEGGDLREYVHQVLLEQIQEKAGEMGGTAADLYWENYGDILSDWASYAVSFDAEGMTVGFSPYELAAYAAGPQVFRLSYDQLLPHLGPHSRALLGLEEEAAS